ncbi:MAG TPA: hypothetical protein VN844_09260 [Pyrinomonadaceae bacterium]|nr:hypothetical protein [Pyrinomonadaceae bacterium]
MTKAKLFSVIGSATLALVLAFGWNLTGWLKDANKISNYERLLILLVLAGIFVVQQIYVALPKPVDNDEIDKRRALMKIYLRSIYFAYCDELKAMMDQKGPVEGAVRVHLMLPTYRAFGLFGSYLKVYYYYSPIVYNPAELDLPWKMNEGTCGWAWSKRTITPWDSEDPELSRPMHDTTERQREVVKSIKSVISFPIRHHGKVVGVLGLDSKLNVTSTKFKEDRMHEALDRLAQALAPYCPADGVKAYN